MLLNLTPDHLDRHGTMQHYGAIKERLVAGSRTAIVGVDDSFCTLIADRIERAGVTVVRISKRNVLADGLYAEGSRTSRRGVAAARSLPISTGSRRSAAAITRRMRRPPLPPASRSASLPMRFAPD